MLENDCVRRITLLMKKAGLTEDTCASDINIEDISSIFYCIPTATMVSSIVLSTILIILSLTVNVKSQTCSNAAPYSSCSFNSGCGCLPYSFSDTMGVCGLLNQSCSVFVACQSPNDACAQSGYICVRHWRCSANPLCYPSTMFQGDVCPPIIVSNYSNALTINSGNYTRYGGSGSFYYHAIEVRVTTAGTYTFRTSSTIGDTYGYLYQGNFYPTYPQYNIVVQNDDSSGNNQFGITATLRSDITYILVFTTYSARATGSFNVSASGPGNLYMNQINI